MELLQLDRLLEDKRGLRTRNGANAVERVPDNKLTQLTNNLPEKLIIPPEAQCEQKYSKEIASKVLWGIASSGKSIDKVSAENNVPSKLLYIWSIVSQEFAAAFSYAKQCKAHAIIDNELRSLDQTQEIIDNDEILPQEKTPHIQFTRIKHEVNKYIAGVYNPQYNPKISVEQTTKSVHVNINAQLSRDNGDILLQQLLGKQDE